MSGGVWVGTVTRVQDSPAACWVRIPRLNRAADYGPVQYLEPSGHHASSEVDEHTHPAVAPLAVGDQVLCAFLEGRAENVIVLGRLAT